MHAPGLYLSLLKMGYHMIKCKALGSLRVQSVFIPKNTNACTSVTQDLIDEKNPKA